MSYLVFKTNPVVSTLFTFVTNLTYTIFLTISLSTTSLNLAKSSGAVFDLSTSILSTTVFKLAAFDLVQSY